MSSNIGPEASAAYQKYLDAATLDEKVKGLEEFLSIVPKHKGTEKIVALNKTRLVKLKRQQEEQKQRLKSIKAVSPFSIKKEGIQVIFISDYHAPGVGKTTLLNHLTGAGKQKIGKFTEFPEIGVYIYNKIRYQIVDMPSIMEGASNGIGNGREILSALRNCDLICLCVDLSRDYKAQLELLLNELSNANVRLNVSPPPIDIQKTGSHNIQVLFLSKEAKECINLTDNIKEVISENGIKHGIVKIFGKITINQIVDALTPSVVYKKAIILGTKGDLPHTSEKFEKLKDIYSDKFPLIIGTSALKGIVPDNFGEVILQFLEKIKVYTMANGIVAEKPLILDKSAPIKDAALKIHKSFFEKFDYAIVMRQGAREKRKRVGLEFVLEDNDTIEFHTI